MSQTLFKAYYSLTKPGIIYGNVLTLIGGFLLASKGHVDFLLLLATLVGTALIIGSACVINNYLDRDIDKHMVRTKERASVLGLVSLRNGSIYAAVLGTAGLVILSLYTNWLVVGIGLAGVLDYVVFYSLTKRRSPHGTLVGTISGATPILAGYCAVTNRLDSGALILFLILVFWQMAHFYAIAIYRLKDYQAAGLPVWPAVKGIPSTKAHIIFYVLAFMVAAAMLTIFGYTGVPFVIVMTVFGLKWLGMGVGNRGPRDDRAWARRMFLFSLSVIVGLSIMLSIDSFLP